MIFGVVHRRHVSIYKQLYVRLLIAVRYTHTNKLHTLWRLATHLTPFSRSFTRKKTDDFPKWCMMRTFTSFFQSEKSSSHRFSFHFSVLYLTVYLSYRHKIRAITALRHTFDGIRHINMHIVETNSYSWSLFGDYRIRRCQIKSYRIFMLFSVLFCCSVLFVSLFRFAMHVSVDYHTYTIRARSLASIYVTYYVCSCFYEHHQYC